MDRPLSTWPITSPLRPLGLGPGTIHLGHLFPLHLSATRATRTPPHGDQGDPARRPISASSSLTSAFWGTVDFTTTSPEDPEQVTRHAVYLPPPKALGREELVEAHEIYGDTIALFAESFLGSGQCCARGECWDLASEGLKYFKDYDYIPKPIPSISRTHGHLIYEGKASMAGREMVGRWRGGDDRIRRGDIAEWRKVRIGIKGARPGSYYTLGDPDHTAVIVAECVPSSTPANGASLRPSDLGVIAVVEQSAGQMPQRREYDLSCFEEGEMWIYRPIGMQAYLSVPDITAVPPEGVRGLQQL
ncbi:hypothetical protein GALMADRAFT_596422 [Galerina marginata CBS 339.88]|uniref:BBC1/AIM3 cysteine proteinase-fold domain-containing protein n=1 Tax=Galerina marginata (strain CBS 339.88) TaxID=685588 RepID=A0A067SVC4_GALM3|nr:hypothetical protein GALMADRAFT_596422 [Galerina marginata CBS 339.88]